MKGNNICFKVCADVDSFLIESGICGTVTSVDAQSECRKEFDHVDTWGVA